MSKFLMTVAAIAVTTLALGSEANACGYHTRPIVHHAVGNYCHARPTCWAPAPTYHYHGTACSSYVNRRYVPTCNNRIAYCRPSCTTYRYAPPREVVTSREVVTTRVVERPIYITTIRRECPVTVYKKRPVTVYKECSAPVCEKVRPCYRPCTTTCEKVRPCYRPSYRPCATTCEKVRPCYRPSCREKTVSCGHCSVRVRPVYHTCHPKCETKRCVKHVSTCGCRHR